MTSCPDVNNLKTVVELSFSCNDVPSKDLLSPSDPIGVLYSLTGTNNNTPTLIGYTEAIRDNANPNWVTKFTLNYEFESRQYFRLEVYDVDDEDDVQNLSKHDYIGFVDFSLAQVVTAQHNVYTTKMKKKNGILRSKCTVSVRADEVVTGDLVAYGQLKANNLSKYGLFSADSTCLEICRLRSDGSLDPIHRTNIVEDSQFPVWDAFSLNYSQMTMGNAEAKVILRVFKMKVGDEMYVPKLLGISIVSAATLIDLGEGHFESKSEDEGKNTKNSENKCGESIMLYKPSSKKKSEKNENCSNVEDLVSNTVVGSLQVVKFKVKPQDTFFDYIRGGLKFNLIVGIDFTQSNLTSSIDLHQVKHLKSEKTENPENLEIPEKQENSGINEYKLALTSVGEILLDYTSSQSMYAYGFGAGVNVDSWYHAISHCFPLTGKTAQAKVQGLDNCLAAYEHALNTVNFSGPTCFSPLIEKSIELANQKFSSVNQHFTILLLLTDGVISDMKETINSIVKASELPLAIVIVGVGPEDFQDMDTLDGDDVVLQSEHGQPASRDIVQFVALRDFIKRTENKTEKERENEEIGKNPENPENSENSEISVFQSELAEETLREIPDQVMSYMKLHDIKVVDFVTSISNPDTSTSASIITSISTSDTSK